MKVSTVAWHIGVALTAATLLFAVMTTSWQLTLTAVAATFLLRKTSAHVPLPRIYREAGLTEEYLMEGRAGRGR